MPEVRILRKWVDEPDQTSIDVAVSRGYYQAARKAILELQPDEITEMVKAAGLRGRGGAGAPTGMKWGFMPKEPTPARPNYLICNADESEPGTYNNREIMERDPHLLIEGMIIGGYAMRAATSFIYIRGEMVRAAKILSDAIADAHRKGFLGDNLFGSNFSHRIILHRGAGAYICGEETALMDSLEGKRGHPRAKPPFPAAFGLYGVPTTINNVETLANVPWIVNQGVDWFRSMGTEKSTGTKLVSVSGHVQAPRNYEVVMGTPMREIIYDMAGGIPGGRQLKAVIPGGASMPMLPKDIVESTNFDFESLQAAGSAVGSAGFMVFDDSTDIVQVCEVIARFYKNESCGKCVPCRIGTDFLHKIIHRITHGHGRMEDIDLLKGICVNLGGEKMMDSRSFCALGDAAAWPIIWGGLKHFQHEFEYWITHKRSPVGAEYGYPSATAARGELVAA
jgi:NADH-quinone oxidoreductase subunit F